MSKPTGHEIRVSLQTSSAVSITIKTVQITLNKCLDYKAAEKQIKKRKIKQNVNGNHEQILPVALSCRFFIFWL
jgi:hypothetical protein